MRILLCFLLMSVVVVLGWEYSLSVTSDKDGTLYEPLHLGNDSTPTTELSNGEGKSFIVGLNGYLGGGRRRRSLMHFTISNAMAKLLKGSTVTIGKVELLVTVRKTSGADTTVFSIHEVTGGGWEEGTSNSNDHPGKGAVSTPGDVTWIHRKYPDVLWSAPGGDFNPTPLAEQQLDWYGTYRWSTPKLLETVRRWSVVPAGNYGILMKEKDEKNRHSAKEFYGRRSSISPPVLVVTYSSLPPVWVWALGGTGAVALVAVIVIIIRKIKLYKEVHVYRTIRDIDALTARPRLKELVMDPKIRLIALKDIVVGKVIGVGSFGSVYEGTYKNKRVAIKRMNISRREKQKVMERDDDNSEDSQRQFHGVMFKDDSTNDSSPSRDSDNLSSNISSSGPISSHSHPTILLSNHIDSYNKLEEDVKGDEHNKAKAHEKEEITPSKSYPNVSPYHSLPSPKNQLHSAEYYTHSSVPSLFSSKFDQNNMRNTLAREKLQLQNRKMIASCIDRKLRKRKRHGMSNVLYDENGLPVEEQKEFSLEMRDFADEIQIMSNVAHPNILPLLGLAIVPASGEVLLVTELMPNGSLADALYKQGYQFQPQEITRILTEIAFGMNHLHSMRPRVIHRDLKPDNILLSKDYTVKISDFGLSTMIKTQTQTMNSSGTPNYMAPETIREGKFSEKSDVYSFGVIIWQLFYNKRPFSDLTPYEILYIIGSGESSLMVDDSCPSPLKDLLNSCISRYPKDRPTFKDIIFSLNNDSERLFEKCFITKKMKRSNSNKG